MLRLFGIVVSIGLADSMNPSMIAPGLYLALGERARSSLIQFTLAVFAVNIPMLLGFSVARFQDPGA